MIQGPCGDGKVNLSCLPQSWCPALPFPTQNHSGRFETEQTHSGTPGSGGSIHWTQRTRETGAGSVEMVYCKCWSGYRWLVVLLAVIWKLLLQWTCTLMQERIKTSYTNPIDEDIDLGKKTECCNTNDSKRMARYWFNKQLLFFNCRLTVWMWDTPYYGWCFYDHNMN